MTNTNNVPLPEGANIGLTTSGVFLPWRLVAGLFFAVCEYREKRHHDKQEFLS